MDKYNIGIIEDDRIIKNALEIYLDKHPKFNCSLSCESVEEFLEKVGGHQEFDVIISDIGLPGMSGIEGISHIKKRMPHVRIVMLTVYDDSDQIFKALCAGATGYLLKNTSITAIGEQILKIGKGGAPMSPTVAKKVIEYFHPKTSQGNLTPKEHQIVKALEDGLSYKLIADRLQISIHTVNSHIQNIYRKLEVNSKSEVVAKSIKGEL